MNHCTKQQLTWNLTISKIGLSEFFLNYSCFGAFFAVLGQFPISISANLFSMILQVCNSCQICHQLFWQLFGTIVTCVICSCKLEWSFFWEQLLTNESLAFQRMVHPSIHLKSIVCYCRIYLILLYFLFQAQAGLHPVCMKQEYNFSCIHFIYHSLGLHQVWLEFWSYQTVQNPIESPLGGKNIGTSGEGSSCISATGNFTQY